MLACCRGHWWIISYVTQPETRKLTLLLTSAESPKAGPLLKCVVILLFCVIYSEADEEGFKNGGAGYSSGSEAGNTQKKSRTNPCVDVCFSVLLGSVSFSSAGRSRARTCSRGFWTTFRHWSESFLNSSHVCAPWLAAAAVQSGRSLLMEVGGGGGDVIARVLDLMSVTFSTFKLVRDAFLLHWHALCWCFVIVMFTWT